jgi:hypothetical protein
MSGLERVRDPPRPDLTADGAAPAPAEVEERRQRFGLPDPVLVPPPRFDPRVYIGNPDAAPYLATDDATQP